MLGGLPVPARAADVPAKGTEILWDRYGIPHIFAPDHPSLFYAYGYAQMEAHSELLVRLYAQARGRGAEFYGARTSTPIAGCAPTDSGTAKQWAAGQSPEFAPLIAAFAAGLNAWAEEHQADLSPAARRVLPLTVEDVYAHGLRVIHYDWMVSPGGSRAGSPARTTRCTGPTNGPSRRRAPPPARRMLMSNSHLQWGDIHTYFEVQLTAPGRHVVRRRLGRLSGAAPVLHRVRRLDADHQQPAESDLYRLVLKDGGYVLDGQVKPFETHSEAIKVREANGQLRDEPLTVRRSVHGPVVAERSGAPIAMRVAAIDRPRLFEQFWRMGLAKNFNEWESGHAHAAAAALQHGLRRPRRPHRLRLQRHAAGACDRRLPVLAGRRAGDRSDLIATAIVPYDAMPKVIDPPTGWVQNSNDMPWTSVYPMVLDPRSSPRASPRRRASRSAPSAASASSARRPRR